MQLPWAWQRIDCPVCPSKRGEYCTKKSGGFGVTHPERVKEAKRLGHVDGAQNDTNVTEPKRKRNGSATSASKKKGNKS